MSHQATEDIAIMRALPDVAVFAPADKYETEAVTKAIVDYPGTCYLRLGRGGEASVHEGSITDFQVGKAIKIYDGKRIAILSTGAIFDEVKIARECLIGSSIEPAVYTFPTVKPLDTDTINNIANEFDLIVTCEEHNIIGGFGSAVAEYISGLDKHPKLLRIGVTDEYCTYVGNQKYLRNKFGLNGESIANKIMEILK